VVGVIVPLQQGFTFREIVIFPTSHVWSQHLPHFPAAVYADFWQPPKIA